MLFGRDQTSVVSHVNKQQRTDFIGDLSKFSVLDLAWVRTRAGDNHLWLVFPSHLGDLIEVEAMRFFVDAVMNEVVQLAREVQVHAVSQVTAMSKTQSHDRIARFNGSQVNRLIGL